jgi:hypothetical protein
MQYGYCDICAAAEFSEPATIPMSNAMMSKRIIGLLPHHLAHDDWWSKN